MNNITPTMRFQGVALSWDGLVRDTGSLALHACAPRYVTGT
ncbi:MAG TPA: hypothetical protein PKI78_11215 [Anaerolineales bacterium]|nr:hypothetical protein [Anaerolineales bacterium]